MFADYLLNTYICGNADPFKDTETKASLLWKKNKSVASPLNARCPSLARVIRAVMSN